MDKLLLLTQADVTVVERRRHVAVEAVNALMTLVTSRVVLTYVTNAVAKCQVVRTTVSMTVTLAYCQSQQQSVT